MGGKNVYRVGNSLRSNTIHYSPVPPSLSPSLPLLTSEMGMNEEGMPPPKTPLHAAAECGSLEAVLR